MYFRFLFAAFILSACSRSNVVTVTIKANPPASKSRAQISASAMDCYLVNISGNGVAPSNYFSTIDATCAQLGTTSVFVSLDQIKSGVKVSVQAGSSRNVQVLGITGSSGCATNGVSVTSAFDTYAKPLVYVLGQQTTDLYSNSVVHLTDSYTSATTNTDLLSGCPLSGNKWLTASQTGAPSPRAHHTAVWTGSQMIVWGGNESSGSPAATGGMYTPSATGGSWVSTSTLNAPAARYGHIAVWTGSQMIVWGGFDVNGLPLESGGIFTPDANGGTWIATSTSPLTHKNYVGVWSGTQLLIWGSGVGEGAMFTPSSSGGNWTTMTTTGQPSGRTGPAAVWTGSQMIVYGGGNNLTTGGIFTPSSSGGSWVSMTTQGAPSGRTENVALWTGTQLFVVGGLDGSGGTAEVGGTFTPSPSGGTWTTFRFVPGFACSDGISPGEVTGFGGSSAIWSGAQAIIWSGYWTCGGSVSPVTGVSSDGILAKPNSSVIATTLPAPTARLFHTAVWTGSEMIIFGGENSGGSPITTDLVGRYVP